MAQPPASFLLLFKNFPYVCSHVLACRFGTFPQKKNMKIPIRIFFQNCVCFGFGYLQMFTEVFMAFFHILFLQRLYGSLIFRRANVIHSMSFTGVTQVLQALSLKQRYLACEMIDFTRCCYTNSYFFFFNYSKCICRHRVSNPAILKALGNTNPRVLLRCLVAWLVGWLVGFRKKN